MPGNIRQLKNAVSSMAAMAVEDEIRKEHFPVEIAEKLGITGLCTGNLDISVPDEGVNVKSVIYNLEKEYYMKALDKTNGNKEEAAKLLGINPPAFRKALRERFEIDYS